MLYWLSEISNGSGVNNLGFDMPVVLQEGATLTKQDVLDHLASKVAKWQLPDDVEFIDEVPKTSVGKFSKKTLRERFTGA